MSLTARPTPGGRAGRADHGISAPFGFSPGYKKGTAFHHGQDYYWLNADPAGSRKVLAAGAGKVIEVFWSDTMGGIITVDHGDFWSRYNHMPRGSSTVSVGDRVTDQTFLGPMGNAGTAAGGQYHLHFEVWVGGTRVDPEPYFVTIGPNQRQVLAVASVNKRTDPTTLSEKIGSAAANSIVNLTGWIRGELVSGVDIWFTDGHGWFWAGGFTDRGTHDLEDVTPVVVPPVEPPVVEPVPPVEPPIVEPTADATPVEPPNPPVTEPATVNPIATIITGIIALAALVAAILFGVR